jgi:hypothetical protein
VRGAIPGLMVFMDIKNLDEVAPFITKDGFDCHWQCVAGVARK